MQRNKIVALCGSTRKTSTNLSLIQAIASLSEAQFNISIYQGLTGIPHFNPDLDTNAPPPEVAEFRQLLKSADGILICTPEYAMGVPGTLKNAIDWTVSSCEFSKKPVALITASSLGEKGHASLLETLRIIEANITDETQLRISYAKTKISTEGIITDESTKQEIVSLLNAFNKLIVKIIL
jgi:chromate reductase, NAD(P)H dehydrogenase (quinone)